MRRRIVRVGRNQTMKRVLLSSILVIAAACGAPDQNLDLGAGSGEAVMEGPDADGNFYVVGLAGAAGAGDAVTLRNHNGDSVVVTADADGSFAGIIWSAMDKTVEVEAPGVSLHAASAAPQKINVNYASRGGLESVPGIGGTLANRILGRRATYGLFAEVDDLLAVQGIGEASLEALRPYLETKIDVNVATKAQLLVLPTIGDAKAAAIIAYRNANGAYQTPDELLNVIAMADYDAIKAFVRAGEVSSHPGASLVNVNEDGIDSLLTLPGIGATKAKAVVDYRTNHGPFYSKEDLLRVPGIGPTTLAGLRELVTVGVVDIRRGTFVMTGTWTHEIGEDSYTEAFPKAVLVKMERSVASNELLVTFVGGGYCEGAEDCSPFTLKGIVIGENADGSFTQRLSGYMPDPNGEFRIFGNHYDVSDVSELSQVIEFTALRGNLERYTVSLTGHRVLE